MGAKSKRALMEAVRASGSAQATPGQDAARSQDFLYYQGELPEKPAMTKQQSFKTPDAEAWTRIDFLPGVELLPLAEPVKDGSIHRARLAKGTVIPVHTHPADEFVLVMTGTVETGGKRCEAGTFWTTPAGTCQGPHIAVSDVELLTIRLGAMGPFGEAA